jgi:hypothetical protein
MNTSSNSAMARKFAAIRDRSPSRVACVFGASTIYGIKSLLRQEARYGDLGIRNGYEASIQFKASDFGTAPVSGDTFSLSSVTKRVLFVETDPTGVTLTVHYGDQQA